MGFVCIVLASLAFGFSPVFETEIMASGMDAQSTLFFVNTFAAAGAVVTLLIGRKKLRVTNRQLWQLLVFGGVSFGLTGLLLVNSYRFVPIGLATMFHFIYPIIVSLAMVTIYNEKASVLKITSILLALAGLYLVLDLSGNLSLKGVALALGSGFTYAVYVGGKPKMCIPGVARYHCCILHKPDVWGGVCALPVYGWRADDAAKH